MSGASQLEQLATLVVEKMETFLKQEGRRNVIYLKVETLLEIVKASFRTELLVRSIPFTSKTLTYFHCVCLVNENVIVEALAVLKKWCLHFTDKVPANLFDMFEV